VELDAPFFFQVKINGPWLGSGSGKSGQAEPGDEKPICQGLDQLFHVKSSCGEWW
jgi:hypothetical protein